MEYSRKAHRPTLRLDAPLLEFPRRNLPMLVIRLVPMVLSSIAMSGQTITTIPSPLPEATLSAPGTQQFIAVVSRLAGAGLAAQSRLAMQYLTALEVAPSVVSVRILWEFTDASGRTTRGLSGIEPLRSRSLVVAPKPYDALASAINGTRPGAAQAPVPDPLAGKSITVSVDSLTLADGTFKGPDRANLYGPMLARERALAAFHAAVAEKAATLSRGELESWIEAQQKSIVADPTASFDNPDLGAAALRRHTNRAKTILSLRGPEALRQWAIEEQSKAGAALHRGTL